MKNSLARFWILSLFSLSLERGSVLSQNVRQLVEMGEVDSHSWSCACHNYGKHLCDSACHEGCDWSEATQTCNVKSTSNPTPIPVTGAPTRAPITLPPSPHPSTNPTKDPIPNFLPPTDPVPNSSLDYLPGDVTCCSAYYGETTCSDACDDSCEWSVENQACEVRNPSSKATPVETVQPTPNPTASPTISPVPDPTSTPTAFVASCDCSWFDEVVCDGACDEGCDWSDTTKTCEAKRPASIRLRHLVETGEVDSHSWSCACHSYGKHLCDSACHEGCDWSETTQTCNVKSTSNDTPIPEDPVPMDHSSAYLPADVPCCSVWSESTCSGACDDGCEWSAENQECEVRNSASKDTLVEIASPTPPPVPDPTTPTAFVASCDCSGFDEVVCDGACDEGCDWSDNTQTCEAKMPASIPAPAPVQSTMACVCSDLCDDDCEACNGCTWKDDTCQQNHLRGRV